MGRKKTYTNTPVLKEKSQYWRVAKYLRLSDTKDQTIESESIENQSLIIDAFIKKQAFLRIEDTYIDDGYTGSNLIRPSFTQLLDDVKSGKINCIIVKDLSRLGRDSVDTRQLIETKLPSLNCRFISLSEEIDTHLRPNEVFDTLIRFTQFINEQFIIEVSSSTRLALDMLRAEGKVVSPQTPYGYLKNPDNKYQYIIDTKSSSVVQSIFSLYMDGMGVTRIAKHLTESNIDTPSMYKKKRGQRKSNKLVTTAWRPDTIRAILRNPVYIGSLEQKKYSKANYKMPKYIKMEKDHRFYIENVHEPIIEKEVFKIVQQNFTKCTYTAPKENKVYMFSGLLRCSDCGSPLIRNSKTKNGKTYVYYKCRAFNQQGTKKCAYSHSISEPILIELVFNSIKTQIFSVANLANVLQKLNANEKTHNRKKHISSKIQQNELIIKTSYSNKLDVYKDWKKGEISKSDYEIFTSTFDKDISKAEKGISHLKKELYELDNVQKKDIKWLTSYLQYAQKTSLTRSMVLSLIDTIYVTRDKNIEIVFRCDDEIKRLTNLVIENVEVVNG